MTKPTDEEAAARRALATKAGIVLREHLQTLDSEARRKCPDLESIRSEYVAIVEDLDAELSKFDHRFGTASEKTATKLRLRILNAKLVQDNDQWASDIKLLQAALEKSNAQVREGVRIVEALVAICHAHSVPIPPDLMGEWHQ